MRAGAAVPHPSLTRLSPPPLSIVPRAATTHPDVVQLWLRRERWLALQSPHSWPASSFGAKRVRVM
jgi:hypothetical protein